MKRWITRIALGLLSLVFLIIAGLLLLLGTEGGVNWLAGFVQQKIPEQLEIKKIEGHLLDRLELSGIRFVSPAGELKVGQLIFSWNPTELFARHVHVEEISAGELEFVAAAGEAVPEESSGTEQVVLPDLELPVDVTLDKLVLNQVRVVSAAEAKPVVIDEAGLSLVWNEDGIELKELVVAMPEGNLKSAGTVHPVGNYPMQLKLAADATLEDLPKVELAGEVQGDLERLLINYRLSGDMTASMNLEVFRMLDAPAWKGNIEIKELRPALFDPELGGVLQGAINLQGDLTASTVTAGLELRDAEVIEMNWDANLDVRANLQTLALEIRQLELKHAEAPARFSLAGNLDEQQRIDLKADWQDVHWPLNQTAQLSLPQGHLSLKGKPEDYRLVLNSSLAGQQLPSGEWELLARGDTGQLQIEQLQGKTLDGVIGLAGAVTWSPAVAWELNLDGDGINPGVISPEWPGRLGWKINSEGNLDDDGINARVAINQLDGVLRDLPVNGKGQVQVKPDRLDIDDLALVSGSARLTARGSLSEQAALDWQADIGNLADLLPDAKGRIQATGRVQGRKDQPELQLTGMAAGVELADVRLEQLDLEGNMDLSWQKPFAIKMTGSALSTGGQLIKTLDLQGAGTREQHNLELNAVHEMATMQITLQGGYPEQQWQGLLQQFDLDGPDLGNWRLKQPATLAAGAEQTQLKDFCLQQDATSLCAEGQWLAENGTGQGKMDLQAFPLALLTPFLPDPIDAVEGEFSTRADIIMADQLKVTGQAEITPGNINYVTEAGSGKVPHQGAKVDLKIEQGGLEADFLLSLDENRFSGNFQSSNLLKAESPQQTQLAGELVIDARKFDLVQVLVPNVKELDAAIEGNFKLSGSLDKPSLNGEGTLQVNQAVVPQAGLDLKDTRLEIVARDRTVTLDGRFNSAEGHLDLDGEALLDGTQGYPLRLAMKGENFRLVSLPEARVNVSPDLLLEKKPDLVALSGEVFVPHADVLLRDVPAGAKSVSGDVVIKEAVTEEQEQTAPLKMNLKVVLGKDVHFVGFGLNAFIDGQLTVMAEPGEQMLGSGEIRIEQGTFRAYGQDLDIEKGIVSFPGGPINKPGINIRATRTIGEVIAGINAIGPADKPRLTTFSTPPMAERDVISYLLIGAPASGAGEGAKLSVGRQINSKLSVAVGTDTKTGDAEFITRYRINRKIHAEITTGSQSNAADLFYTIEMGGEEGQEAEAKPDEGSKTD